MFAGDSAGGNLAAAVAINVTNDASTPSDPFRFVSLDYPALQMSDFSNPAYRKYEYGPCLLEKKRMLNYWLYYAFGNLDNYNAFWDNLPFDQLDNDQIKKVSESLIPPSFKANVPERAKPDPNRKFVLPDEMRSILLNPMLAPLMAEDEDLASLPPTYILTAEFDVLRDDGLMFAERLKMIGIEVTQSYVSNEEHGFALMVDVFPTAVKELEDFLVFFKKHMA